MPVQAIDQRQAVTQRRAQPSSRRGRMSNIANGVERFPSRDTRTPPERSTSAEGRPDSVRRPDCCRCAQAAGERSRMRIRAGRRAQARTRRHESCRLLPCRGGSTKRSLSRRRPSQCRRSLDMGVHRTKCQAFLAFRSLQFASNSPNRPRDVGGAVATSIAKAHAARVC